MRVVLRVVLVLGLIAPGSVAGALQDGERADPADELLAKAEEQAAQGSYKKARSTYKKLAEDYPDTPAGRIAERRSLPSAYLGRAAIVRNGPSENRVDVLLMGDGYTLTLRGLPSPTDDGVTGDMPTHRALAVQGTPAGEPELGKAPQRR